MVEIIFVKMSNLNEIYDYLPEVPELINWLAKVFEMV